jgi:hypothetical protein
VSANDVLKNHLQKPKTTTTTTRDHWLMTVHRFKLLAKTTTKQQQRQQEIIDEFLFQALKTPTSLLSGNLISCSLRPISSLPESTDVCAFRVLRFGCKNKQSSSQIA